MSETATSAPVAVRVSPGLPPPRWELRVPGSKSLTNRALVLAALSDGACELTNVLFADDTRVMLDGLKKLGFEIEIDEPSQRVRVVGAGGSIPATSADLFCGNSWTTSGAPTPARGDGSPQRWSQAGSARRSRSHGHAGPRPSCCSADPS